MSNHSKRCDRCHEKLIEIDDRGTRLVGCLACNDWRSIDGLRRVKLADEDVEALRSIKIGAASGAS